MSVTMRTAPAAFEKTARRPLGSTRSRGRHRRNLHKRIVSGPLSHGGWSLVVAMTAVSGFNFALPRPGQSSDLARRSTECLTLF